MVGGKAAEPGRPARPSAAVHTVAVAVAAAAVVRCRAAKQRIAAAEVEEEAQSSDGNSTASVDGEKAVAAQEEDRP